ncbi:MAG: hypothetical protein U0441_06430 [Polyangiaceae bacterium]
MSARSALGLVVSLVAVALCVSACRAEDSGVFGSAARTSDTPCTASCGCEDGPACPACVNDEMCPQSSDPCVISRCGEGVCNMGNRPDGMLVDGLQTTGDCRKVVCLSGAVASQPDLDDPDDDSNDCTRDECATDGGILHVAVPDGTPCDDAKGLCKGGSCKRLLGEPCFDATDCATGFCANGACCESTCKGTCFACDLPGKAGSCMPVPVGARHPGCPENQVCLTPEDGCTNLAGNGYPCNAAWDCASQSCKDGRCRQSDGTPCLVDEECCSGACKLNVCVDGGAACDGQAATN